MAKFNNKLTRAERWHATIDEINLELKSIRAKFSALSDFSFIDEKLESLCNIQDEYNSWLESLSENLQSSRTAELLDEISSLSIEDLRGTLEESINEFEDVLESIESAINEAENVTLPRGFGRD